MKKRLLALLFTLTLCLGLASPVLAASLDESGFVISGNTLTRYQGKGGDVVIPGGVTTIGSGAFDRCTTVSSVVIPQGVTYIGINAFRDCIALSKVSFPGTLREIDSGAFQGCISLTAVDIPDSVTRLGERGGIFSGCTSLRSATLGKGITGLPHAAFRGCTNLNSVTIPSSVTYFSWPFPDCPNLTIYGESGSRAQEYAVSSGIPFSTGSAPSGGLAGFTDVSPRSPYAAAILWALEYRITTGVSAASFAPDAACTVGQMLTFLWRSQGSPKSREANHFTDPIPEPHRMAAVWAYEKGLVAGPTLGANQPCTRGQVILWLWKLAGSPPAYSSSFQDLSAGSDLFIPACWAVNNGVAEKDSGGRFNPSAVCSRGQALTCLYQSTQKGVPAPTPQVSG